MIKLLALPDDRLRIVVKDHWTFFEFSECVLSIETKYSVANYNYNVTNFDAALNLVLFLALVALFHYIVYKNRLYYLNYDERNVTPDDFTLVLSNLKKNYDE